MPETDREPLIRAARVDEAAALSDLVLRSKAHWGYDRDFLDACRVELTLTAADIEQDVVIVLAEGGDEPTGVYRLRPTEAPAAADLDLFYLAPELIGKGHGRRLWRHMVRTAAAHGYRRVVIDSDPHAEGFYRAMGAQRIGEVPSGSIPGRSLPQLQYDLEATEETP